MPAYANCTHCFMPVSGNTVCPHCGNDPAKNKQYPGALPAFTPLNDRYIVGRVLGKGGFGITYVAKDMITNRTCAIKEYMPAEYSSRANGTLNIVPFADDKVRRVFDHGKAKLIDEVRTLMKLRGDPIVVDIWDYFTANNTAYMVMEYIDGQNLRSMAKANGGKVDPDFVKFMFVTVASSLMEIHAKGILHRDLSPENIMYSKNGEIKLIDFGAARSFVSSQNKGMSILLKPGFAPPEQYNAKGTHGPWSDVYALCATFYNLVSGKPLVDALFRYRGEKQPSLAALGCPVTKRTSDVIEKGMELDIKHRYKDFKALLDDIDITLSQTSNQERRVSQSNYQQGAANSGGKSGPNTNRQVTPPPPPPKKPPYVAAVVGNTLCNKVPVKAQDVLKIGRLPQSCQYVVSGDTNISRTHCYLRYDGSKVYLCDVSANGTYFENGQRLQKNREYEIAPGTKFYLATRNRMLILMV